LSEVFAAVDATHGKSPDNQWVELYNGSQSQVDVSRWTLHNTAATSTLPNGVVIQPGTFAVVTMATSTRNFWNISNSVPFVILGNPIAGGLSGAGDQLILADTQGTLMDSLSWGTSTSTFNPSAPSVANGHSLFRISLTGDSHSAIDWAEQLSPSPGVR
jgi:hypothetical protein